jgi:general stress protein 26
MSKLTLSELSEKLHDAEIVMLSTHAADGNIAIRPMSAAARNAPDGVAHFFAVAGSGLVDDIARNPKVGLSLQARGGIVGQRPFLMTVEGTAELTRDRESLAAHWSEDLTRWFARDIDTPGLLLVTVRASRVHYWDGDEAGVDEGEIVLVDAGG